MQRINTPSAAAGHFVQGDPDNNIPPTQLSAAWFEGVQEELCAVIEGVGLPLAAGDNAQLLRAIQALIARAGVAIPAGTVTHHAGSSMPEGYAECDGGLVPINQCPGLYAAIGNTFNGGVVPAGTFRLPDLRGRMPLGAGHGTGLAPRAVGETGGEESHILTIDEMPSHRHGSDTIAGGDYGLIRRSRTGESVTVVSADALDSGVEPQVTGNIQTTEDPIAAIPLAGGGQAHNTLPPYVVLRAIIKLGPVDAARDKWVLP